jgi:hypothetical protein
MPMEQRRFLIKLVVIEAAILIVVTAVLASGFVQWVLS